jgi:hypothetical protein
MFGCNRERKIAISLIAVTFTPSSSLLSQSLHFNPLSFIFFIATNLLFTRSSALKTIN